MGIRALTWSGRGRLCPWYKLGEDGLFRGAVMPPRPPGTSPKNALHHTPQPERGNFAIDATTQYSKFLFTSSN